MREFSDEEFRLSANLAQAYEGMKESILIQRSLPRHMTWKTINETRYLYQMTQAGEEKSMGRESDATISAYNKFKNEKQLLTETIDATRGKIARIAAQYRALRMPQVMSMPAKILQEMDMSRIGDSFLVVGSCAFPAYEIEAGAYFMSGLDETEDFDISWTPPKRSAGKLSLSATTACPLHSVLLSVDKSFSKSMLANHKVRNKSAFEVDVLCSQGDIFNSDPESRSATFGGLIEPLEMEGQDLLHCGTRLSQIITGRDGTPALLSVPDPRVMATHKLWLSQRRDRIPQKIRKDKKQSDVLFSAIARMPRFPFDESFIDTLPDKWQSIATERLTLA